MDNVKGKTIILVEGVFDAMKLGDNAVASFGTALSVAQMNLIQSLYSKVVFLFDNEEEAQRIASSKASTLSAMGVRVENVALDKGDAGDLTVREALQLKSDLGVI